MPEFRPHWWPEGEPFPPMRGRPWGGRPRFPRFLGLVVVVFFLFTFTSSALAVALLSGALGIGHHRGLALAAGVLGLVILFAGLAAVGRGVRRAAVPLADVMEAADRVAAGDHDVQVPERGPRRFRRLARSFNAMTERLRASERERRNLIADVAHELRTPLTVIQGQTEGLLDGLYSADREHLEPLLEETRVMSRLLNDLLTLSTAEAGALRLHRESVQPQTLVNEAVEAFEGPAAVGGVVLDSHVADGLPTLDVDPIRIGEVLANLLSNALRHTPSGGRISMSAEPADGAVAFVVTDTGSGIAPDALPHVFDRFVKSSDSSGAGLGLAIAKSLVLAHGGTISAESPHGAGTTMRFVLPAEGIDRVR
jgi:signal transduction histidine kinase